MLKFIIKNYLFGKKSEIDLHIEEKYSTFEVMLLLQEGILSKVYIINIT